MSTSRNDLNCQNLSPAIYFDVHAQNFMKNPGNCSSLLSIVHLVRLATQYWELLFIYIIISKQIKSLFYTVVK